MEQPRRFAVRLTHDCGQQREIPVTSIAEPFTCAGCGKEDVVSPENVKLVMDRAGATLMEADRLRRVTGQDATVVWNAHTDRFE